ncbi:MAG: carbohydrate kinase [Candidatus Eremiobacteraeota bacterium]|nr:carbohydrate kinase [Candidatus Eremiobacteraeota bacterium]
MGNRGALSGTTTGRVVCIGGATIDRTFRLKAPVVLGTSNPTISDPPRFGGVARNVAENLTRLGVSATLVTALAEDGAGAALRDHLRRCGIETHVVGTRNAPTAQYLAILGTDNELAFGIDDVRAMDELHPDAIKAWWPNIGAADWLFLDCNVPPELVEFARRRTAGGTYRLALDAVSTFMVRKLGTGLRGLDAFFLNEDEGRAYLGIDPGVDADPREVAQLIQRRGAEMVVLTLGSRGAIVATPGDAKMVNVTSVAAVDVTGAGDALISGTLARLLTGVSPLDAVRTGTTLASLTIQQSGSVVPELSASLLERAEA